MSDQPSPSASKNTPPAPSVSGRYFFPNAPLLCVNVIPAAAVTSVNVTVGAAAAPARSSTAAPRVTSARGTNGSVPAMLVDLLPLVVVVRRSQSKRPRDRLRALVGLEPVVERLLAL